MTTRTTKSAQSTLTKLRSAGATKGSAAKRASGTDRLRTLYRTVKDARTREANAKTEAQQTSAEAVALATELEQRENPVSFEYGGQQFVGVIISPQGSDTWDIEKVVEYLHKENRWEECSTRVFDPDKWESVVQSGSVAPSTARRFRIPGVPKTPYVKITAK